MPNDGGWILAMSVLIEIFAVAYRRYGELAVFVQSILNQTNTDWILTVMHDGPDPQFDAMLSQFKSQRPDSIFFESTLERYNDYGHTLRGRGIAGARGKYILLTNADNYFVPKALEYITQATAHGDPDVVMFDMVHSHIRPGGRALPDYSFFKTAYSRGNIDISAAVVRTSLAREAGFRDKSHDGDASYFEDVARAASPTGLSVIKINRVLLVHN